MQTNPGGADMFEALADEGINIHMISTKNQSICLIDKDCVETAVRALHRKFELDGYNKTDL